MRLHNILPIMAAVLCMGASPAARGEGTTTTDKAKFSVRPAGRLLIDGALYASPQKEDFKDGAAIPDVRLGAKMGYGKWSATIEVGLAYGKVGMREMYLQYDFNDKHSLRAGNYIHQYGLQSYCGSSSKCTMEEPVSNAIFAEGYLLGVGYTYSGSRFFAAASAHVEPSAMTEVLTPDKFTKEGYGFLTRLLYRPVHSDGVLLQAGISGGFATPQLSGSPDTHDAFTFKARFPTRVTQVTALETTVDHAGNLWKFTPELMLSYGRVALESQYYFNRVNRKGGLHAYTGQGAYVTVRGLILGDRNYGYNAHFGGFTSPGKGTLEAVLSYNYTDATCAEAGLYGGHLNDFSVTCNYYINKYVTARLHYSRTHTWGNPTVGNKDLNAFMARVQVMF